MANNNQFNINELSQIQEDNNDESITQMSILNQLDNGVNFLNQGQFTNSFDQIQMNNFQNINNQFNNQIHK